MALYQLDNNKRKHIKKDEKVSRCMFLKIFLLTEN